MLDVFLTVDVEVWCGSWENLDAAFPRAFQRYVYGRTTSGEFGLPLQMKLLAQHDLRATFFVEPLFAARFGISPLEEIVGLLRDGRQDVQLHLHTEWVNEVSDPLLPRVDVKKQFLRDFPMKQQSALIAAGQALLRRAGQPAVCAFRAGNFGFNSDTLIALAANGIPFDSSYNAIARGQESGIAPGQLLVEPIRYCGIFEYPMTVFRDGSSRLRQVSVTACSYREIEGLLWRALKERRRTFLILWHNFELLDSAKERGDRTVVERMTKLFRFLDQHRDSFRVRTFTNLIGTDVAKQPDPLVSPPWRTGLRMLEQARRRLYA